jgi:hypothetical protein
VSMVTNFILTCGLRDKGHVTALPVAFGDLRDLFGGPKNVEAGVFGYAANYLNEAELLAALGMVEWEHPERVRVFVQRHEEDVFTQMWPVMEGKR